MLRITHTVLDIPRAEVFDLMAPYVLDCLCEARRPIRVRAGATDSPSLLGAQLEVILRVLKIFCLDYVDTDEGYVIILMGDSPPLRAPP